MSDYIKQLEASNEELQARLAKLEGGLRFDKPRPQFHYAYLIVFLDGRYCFPSLSRMQAKSLIERHKIQSSEGIAVGAFHSHMDYICSPFYRIERHTNVDDIQSIHIRIGMEHMWKEFLSPYPTKTDIPLFIKGNIPAKPRWYMMPFIWYKRLCDGYYWDFKSKYQKKQKAI